MRMRHGRVVLAAALLAAARGASAQVPDTFTNLQVLPKDISKAALTATMRGFAGSLGVKCNHCHVPAAAGDGMDFASDAKETKTVARAMIRMTQEINTRLLPQTGRKPVLEVRCVTCHRGVTRPEPLVDILRAAAKEGGAAAAITRYGALRETHYGRGAYDFGPPTLNQLAETLAETDVAGAIAVQQMNLEAHPGVATSHSLLGRLYEKKGDRAAALAQFERAAALDPADAFFKKKVEELKAPASPAPAPSPRS